VILLCPLSGEPILTSPFRPPSRPGHDGIDLRAAVGTLLRAPEDMIVSAITTSKTAPNGLSIVARSLTRRWAFLHLDRLGPDITIGAYLRRGDVFGWTGQTGDAKGPHLHLEVRPLLPNGSGAADKIDPWPLVWAGERWEHPAEGEIGITTGLRATE
jgi:murein DD-endopeptidase MepM/ murein hydrolase activator NlpD